MADDLPTARSMLRQDAWLWLLAWCKACDHQAPADLQAIIDVGRGDVPLKDLRFRCTECGSRLTDSVVMARGMRCGCSHGEQGRARGLSRLAGPRA